MPRHNNNTNGLRPRHNPDFAGSISDFFEREPRAPQLGLSTHKEPVIAPNDRLVRWFFWNKIRPKVSQISEYIGAEVFNRIFIFPISAENITRLTEGYSQSRLDRLTAALQSIPNLHYRIDHVEPRYGSKRLWLDATADQNTVKELLEQELHFRDVFENDKLRIRTGISVGGLPINQVTGQDQVDGFTDGLNDALASHNPDKAHLIATYPRFVANWGQ